MRLLRTVSSHTLSCWWSSSHYRGAVACSDCLGELSFVNNSRPQVCQLLEWEIHDLHMLARFGSDMPKYLQPEPIPIARDVDPKISTYLKSCV